MKNAEIIITGIVIIAILAFAMLLFGNTSYGMMGRYGYYMVSGFGSFGIFMLATWVLVIVALALFIIWIVNQLQNNKGGKRQR